MYVDWNLAQYLAYRDDLAFGELMRAILRCRLAHAALVPYSVAHMMDATTGWPKVGAVHRVERLRRMLFLDGLTGSMMWEFPSGQDGHFFRHESFVDACELRGHFSDLRNEAPELVRAHGTALRERLESAKAEIRATSESSPNVPPELGEAVIDELEGLFAEGLPEISDSGRVFASIMRPVFLHVMNGLPSLDDLAPEDVVARIDAYIDRATPGATFAGMTATLLAGQVGLHPDDYGPMMLGWLGYHKERRKDVIRGAPGIAADQTHGRFAMSSGLFLTSDLRLERRCAAWAAHTGRGAVHGTWPILLHVAPDDPRSVERATLLVDAFTTQFHGLVDDVTRPA